MLERWLGFGDVDGESGSASRVPADGAADGPSLADGAVASVTAAGPVPPIVDADTVAALIALAPADEPGFLGDVLELFFEEAADLRARLADALATGDETAARSAAHTLKGAAGNVGATRVASLCAEIGQALAAGRTAEATELIEELSAAWPLTETSLRRLAA